MSSNIADLNLINCPISKVGKKKKLFSQPAKKYDFQNMLDFVDSCSPWDTGMQVSKYWVTKHLTMNSVNFARFPSHTYVPLYTILNKTHYHSTLIFTTDKPGKFLQVTTLTCLLSSIHFLISSSFPWASEMLTFFGWAKILDFTEGLKKNPTHIPPKKHTRKFKQQILKAHTPIQNQGLNSK